MDRREFLKSAFLGTVGLTLPIAIASELVIVDVGVFDQITELMKIKSTTIVDGQIFADVEVDTSRIWDYVFLIDEDNNRWITPNKGKTWHCGLMSFELESEFCHIG